MDRCQTNVASLWRVASVFFHVVEKAANERRIQIPDVQRRRCFLKRLLCKLKEQTEGIPVAGDGVGTGTALSYETIRKIGLK
jgi:hypothetical protein